MALGLFFGSLVSSVFCRLIDLLFATGIFSVINLIQVIATALFVFACWYRR